MYNFYICSITEYITIYDYIATVSNDYKPEFYSVEVRKVQNLAIFLMSRIDVNIYDYASEIVLRYEKQKTAEKIPLSTTPYSPASNNIQ